jgi:hypothetical protein
MVCAPPFWLTPLRNRRQAPSLTPRRSATRTLRSRIFGPKFISVMPCRKKRAESVQHMQSRRYHGPNMAMHRGHMEPFSMRRRALRPLKIHYMSRDHPKAHELTNHILHPSPAPCRRSPAAPGNVLRRWYGIVPVSPTGTTGSLPRIL